MPQIFNNYIAMILDNETNAVKGQIGIPTLIRQSGQDIHRSTVGHIVAVIFLPLSPFVRVGRRETKVVNITTRGITAK